MIPIYIGIYRIADFTVEISSIYQEVQTYCQDYISKGKPEFSIVISQADIDYERRRSDKQHQLEKRPAPEFSDSYLETLAVYRKLADYALTHGALLFHGSSIAYHNEACLFTATSGTGKSTHSRLWREAFGDEVFMVNDDKPLLKICGNQILVCGTPWNGKHRLGCNCMVPLKAIVILERGDENEIHRISPAEALPMLMQQSYRPSDPLLYVQFMQIMDELTKKLRFYRLHCNQEPEAAEVSFESIFGKDTD